jgi:hypothetical protein
MAKGNSGSNGKGKGERISSWRRTSAQRRNPQRRNDFSQEAMGTPF